MEIEWHSADFKTGIRGNRIEVESCGTLSRIINESTTAPIVTPCSKDGQRIPGWEEATEPGRAMLIAVDKDGDRIIWGGLVRDDDSTAGALVTLPTDTLESYFYRRYINAALTWVNADASTVAADVLAQITDLPPLVVRATPTGHAVIDGHYDDTDNKKIGDVLSDLAGLDRGIEWTVELEWADAAHTQLQYVVVIAPRLGTAGTSGAQWTMPGCVTEIKHRRSFGPEWGANDVLALSSGEGGSKPRSTRYVDDALIAGGYARFEYRGTPAPSITSTTTLDEYAAADLAAMRLGLSSLSLVASLDAAPRVGLDWWMGDDIDVALTCDRFPARHDAEGFASPGFEATLRTIGWDLDPAARTITPRILEARP